MGRYSQADPSCFCLPSQGLLHFSTVALLQIFTKQRKSRFIENRPTKNTFLQELFKNDVTNRGYGGGGQPKGRKTYHDDKRGLGRLSKTF